MSNLELLPRSEITKTPSWTCAASAAQSLIHLLEPIKLLNETQSTMLAAAYYTLAIQKNISHHQSKRLLNAAIVVLNKIPADMQKESWRSQIAHAYFKRAERLEENYQFITAADDYLKAIAALEHPALTLLEDEDRILLAEASVSIADLIVSGQLDLETSSLTHPLFFINKALDNLGYLTTNTDESWILYAYAHQIAAIILSSLDQFTAAKEAFSLALCMVFKTEHTPLCSLLADIYTNLGLLYEQQYTQYAVQKTFDNFPQHAALYFDLACLFTAHEIDESSEATTTLEPLFELIYHAVDPYLPPFSYDASCNLIDALIYVYICVINKILPNQAIGSELNKPGMLDTFAQHIHWLIMEAYYKKHPRIKTPFIFESKPSQFEADKNQILKLLQNTQPNNIHYLTF